MLEVGTRRPAASVSSVSSPLERVEAAGLIDGLLLEMNVTQHYRNTSQGPIEIAYTFPLARAAVPLQIAARIGSRELVGRVKAKYQAARDYEAAVEEGDSAVLVSRAADGMLSASLGNLLPGETAQITLRYGQLLDVANGRVRIAFPTVIAPRYGDPADAGLDPLDAPETDLRAEYPLSFALEIHGALAQADVACPSHAAQLTRVGEALRLTVDRAALDRDLVVLAGNLPAESAGYAALGRDGAQTVALASVVVPAACHAALPLAVKVLVDCSGSMNGGSINQAREALGDFLRRLEDTDRMSLTRFGSTCHHEGEGLADVSGTARRRLRQAIGALEADLGGTKMEGALEAVYALPAPDKGAVVLLITDGEINATESLIAAAGASGHRLFIVAVGTSPAESWLAKLAEQTGGAIEFATPGEDIQAAIGRLCAKLRAPRQKLLKVMWPGKVDLVGAAPAVAYEGETLHLFARLLEPPAGELVVEFAAGTVRRTLPADYQPGDTLARLFAAQRLRHETDAAQRACIAESYQLLTEDTSWVLTLERAADEKGSTLPELQKVPQMMAAGWGGTGTPAVWRSRGSAASAVARMESQGAISFSRKQSLDNWDESVGSEKLLSMDVSADTFGDIAFLRSTPASPPHPLQGIAQEVWGGATLAELPATLDELAAAGVPQSAIDELRALLSMASEKAIVWQFIRNLFADLDIELVCHVELWDALQGEAPTDDFFVGEIWRIAMSLR